jgi:WD40 repeat protein/energy-coupling factor transporter ATP-binding protein EcfA2
MDSAPEPLVFLSHAGVDTVAAHRFAAQLRANGVRVWLDKDDLPPGDLWMAALERAIQESSAMVVYVGASGVQRWVDREVRLALELNTRDPRAFKVVPVFADAADLARLPPFLSQHQGVRADDPHAIRRLVEVLRGCGAPAVPTAYWATHSPFRSLRSFEPEDAWLFFGRDTETTELLSTLEQSRVQIVIGNSGSGKSSLVRAGVIPALLRGRFRVDGSPVEQWRIAIFRPGNDPFGQLADRLPRQLVPELPASERDELITRWRETFPNGGDAVRSGLAALQIGESRTLLFADQFEELFTLVPEDAVRRRYIDALLNATAADGVHLIIGVRADFYAQCLHHRPLQRFVQRNYSVLLMQPEQLREAVEKRLAIAVTDAAPGLVGAVIADVGTEPGNLALLEHTLAQLWVPANGRYTSARLTNERYEEIGRLKGAIGTHAQHVYAALDADLQPLVRKILLELVHLGEGAQDTRRRVQKAHLLTLDNADVVERVLNQLASERLIATSRENAESPYGFVEVSHEALIRELRFARRLGVDAEDWASSPEGGGLLHGARLPKAKEWLRQHPEAPTAVRSFVDASDLAEASAQAARIAMFRRFAWTMAALVVLISAVAVYAYRQQRVAESRQLAIEAQELHGRRGDQPGALNLAINAWRLAGTPEAHRAIATSFTSASIGLTGHSGAVTSAVFSANGKQVVTASADRTARVWDARSGQTTATIGPYLVAVYSAVFSPDGRRVLTASSGMAAILDAQSGKTVMSFDFDEQDLVTNALFSPDGERVVMSTVDQTVWIGNVQSGKKLAISRGHTGKGHSGVFSRDGRRVVTASDDGTAEVWDAAAGKRLERLKGHTGAVISAAFSPNDEWILTTSADGTARVWNAQSGEMLVTLHGHGAAVRSAMFSPDGRHIVSCSDDGTPRVWDARSGQTLARLQGHTDVVSGAVFSPDGQRVVTASGDGTARVWDALSGEMLVILEGHTAPVSSAVFSPDGNRVLTASTDGTARIWDAWSSEAVTLYGHTGNVSSALFSTAGQWVVTASMDRTARVWDAHSGKILVTLRGHTANIRSAMFSPGGRQILTGSEDRTARVWDAQSGQVTAILTGHTSAIWSADFSPDGRRIVTGSVDGTARVWDGQSGQGTARLVGHTAAIWSAVFSPDGRRIVTGSADGTARVWDARSGDAVLTLQGGDSAVWNVVFSPDNERVVTAGAASTGRVWDAHSGQHLLTLQGHTGSVRSVVFSPDGQQIVTASSDATARVWDARSGKMLAVLVGHKGVVRSAMFSPDGQRIITASDDRTARLWDARSGEALVVLLGHNEPVNSAVFSPTGQQIITASSDRTARMFRVVGFGDLAALFH